MTKLVSDCPMCGTMKITFDFIAMHRDPWYGAFPHFDAFCACVHCGRTTVFLLTYKTPDDEELVMHVGIGNLDSLNSYFEIRGFKSLKDQAAEEPPEHLPEAIKAAFEEGATCVAVGCYNAGATMFRMCLDIATKQLLPSPAPASLTPHIQRNLGPRMGWLFDNQILPDALRDLSHCIKDDGNDGAHDGTLGQADAEDLMDFTVLLLERLYTEPADLRLAAARRTLRRNPPTP